MATDVTQPKSLPERLPTVGELVQVRSRRWLVEEVVAPEDPKHSPVLRLACADYWNLKSPHFGKPMVFGTG